MLAGHVTLGTEVSVTVNVVVHMLMLVPSDAVTVIVVVPTGTSVPAVGL